jgi:hypothetical protein
MLQELVDAGYGEKEVRLMTQQNYPFENEAYGVTTGEELEGDEEAVYVVEGRQLGQGDQAAWNTAQRA